MMAMVLMTMPWRWWWWALTHIERRQKVESVQPTRRRRRLLLLNHYSCFVLINHHHCEDYVCWIQWYKSWFWWLWLSRWSDHGDDHDQIVSWGKLSDNREYFTLGDFPMSTNDISQRRLWRWNNSDDCWLWQRDGLGDSGPGWCRRAVALLSLLLGAQPNTSAFNALSLNPAMSDIPKLVQWPN